MRLNRMASQPKLRMVLIASGVAAALLSATAVAETLVETNRYGGTYIAYAQVHRPDGTYRRMLTTLDILEAAASGAPLPNGTHILMESYYAPGEIGTVFHKRKVDGKWQYGSFSGTGNIDLSTEPRVSCLSCHAQVVKTDFTFTHQLMEHALADGFSTVHCNRTGRTPCDAVTYRFGSGP
ncbi:MAG: hypothetical protein ABJP33_21540 [Pseudoruegeria sp.]